MFKNFYQKHFDILDKFSGFFLHNPVLYRGLVLAPVIIASTSLKKSVLLGLAFIVITFITVFVSSFIPKVLPHSFKVILYVFIAALVFVPVAWALGVLMPMTLVKVGIFLPLLITNSLIVSRSESRFFKMSRKQMALDLSCNVLGFFVVICLVGIIRELTTYATIWDIPFTLFHIRKTPAMSFPFSGFILVGFLAALLQKLRLNILGNNPTPKQTDISQTDI